MVEHDCLVSPMPSILPYDDPIESTLLHENDFDDDMNISHEVVEHDCLVLPTSPILALDIFVGCSKFQHVAFSEFGCLDSGYAIKFLDPFDHYFETLPMKLMTCIYIPSSESSASLGDKLRRYLVGTL